MYLKVKLYGNLRNFSLILTSENVKVHISVTLKTLEQGNILDMGVS